MRLAILILALIAFKHFKIDIEGMQEFALTLAFVTAGFQDIKELWRD